MTLSLTEEHPPNFIVTEDKRSHHTLLLSTQSLYVSLSGYTQKDEFGVSRQEILAKLWENKAVGHKVSLIHEPGNQYDRNCIRVFCRIPFPTTNHNVTYKAVTGFTGRFTASIDIGFIPAHFNAQITQYFRARGVMGQIHGELDSIKQSAPASGKKYIPVIRIPLRQNSSRYNISRLDLIDDDDDSSNS